MVYLGGVPHRQRASEECCHIYPILPFNYLHSVDATKTRLPSDRFQLFPHPLTTAAMLDIKDIIRTALQEHDGETGKAFQFRYRWQKLTM